MEERDRDALRELLNQRRVAVLAVLVAGKPNVSLVPFTMTGDFRAVLVHASRLARHSAGLTPGAPFGLLVHESDTAGRNPQQLARVSLQGSVHPIDPGDPGHEPARQLYLHKFPKSQPTFKLGDFRLYELRIEGGRFVASFGRIYDLAVEELERLAPGV